MTDQRPIAIGCMRLSTERDRDEDAAVAVLHAALDAGTTLLDTADAYCWTDDDRGHNERLIARALGSWSGDRGRVTVATKGGLTRPDGRWVPNGRAKHLTAACESSCRALAVSRIDLYQLHAPDPHVPLATSVRALAALQRDGLVDRIGLCNVTVGQIDEARRIVEIDSVQIEVSLWNDQHLLSGVVEYCRANKLRLLAYRPLGGSKRRPRVGKHPVLREIAAAHGVTSFDVALAWVHGLGETIVALPGPTRIETAKSIAHYRQVHLTPEEIRRFDVLCPAARSLRGEAAPAVRAHPQGDAEVVLVMGLPGAGKSTTAAGYAADGYLRLNRDETGGSLRELAPAMARALSTGTKRIVLDNTYVSRASRAVVIQAAAAHGVPVRCVWLQTSLNDALVNAAWRLVDRYGRLPDPHELAVLRKRDPAAFAPTNLYRYQRELEPPDAAEGFTRVDVVPFERHYDPAFTNRAVIVWCDGVLLGSRSGNRRPADVDDLLVDPRHGDVLRDYAARGFGLLGLSWQPEIEEQERTPADAEALFARMNEALGVPIEVEYCAHGAGPVRCWCRKPMPGLGVALIHRHRLNPAACVFVGDGAHDAGYARQLGFELRSAADFFAAE